MRKYLLHVLIISFVLLCNFGCAPCTFNEIHGFYHQYPTTFWHNKFRHQEQQSPQAEPDSEYTYSDSEDTYSNRKKYKELDEKKYPGINEKQRRMQRAINKDDSEALYKELFPGDLPIESYGY